MYLKHFLVISGTEDLQLKSLMSWEEFSCDIISFLKFKWHYRYHLGKKKTPPPLLPHQNHSRIIFSNINPTSCNIASEEKTQHTAAL
jgi:hypothetical protein